MLITTLLIYISTTRVAWCLPVAESILDGDVLPHSQDYYAGYIKALADNYDNIFSSGRETRSADPTDYVSNQDNEGAKPENVGQQAAENSAAPSTSSESVAPGSSASDVKATNLEPSGKVSSDSSADNNPPKTESSEGLASQAEASTKENGEKMDHTPTEGQAKDTSTNDPGDLANGNDSQSIGSSKDQVQTYPGDHNPHSEDVNSPGGDQSDTKTEEPATPAAALTKSKTDLGGKGEAVNQTERVENFIASPDKSDDNDDDDSESGSGEETLRQRLVASFSKKSKKDTDLETARDIHHYDGSQELEDMRKRNSEDSEDSEEESDTLNSSQPAADSLGNAEKRSDQTNSTSKVISGSYSSYTPGNPFQQPTQSAKAPPTQGQQQNNINTGKANEKPVTKKSKNDKVLVYGDHLPSVVKVPGSNGIGDTASNRIDATASNGIDATASNGIGAATPNGVGITASVPDVHLPMQNMVQPSYRVNRPGQRQGYLLEHSYGEYPLFGGLLPYDLAFYPQFNYGLTPYRGNVAYPGYRNPYEEMAYYGNQYDEPYYGMNPAKKGELPVEEPNEENEEESGQKEENSEENQNSGSQNNNHNNENNAKGKPSQEWREGIVLLPPPHGLYEYGSLNPWYGRGCGCGCNCGCGCGCNCGCGCQCGCGCNGKCNCNCNKNGGKNRNNGKDNGNSNSNNNNDEEDNDDGNCNVGNTCNCGCPCAGGNKVNNNQRNSCCNANRNCDDDTAGCDCMPFYGASVPILPAPSRMPGPYGVYNRRLFNPGYNPYDVGPAFGYNGPIIHYPTPRSPYVIY